MGKYSGWFLVELEQASSHLPAVKRGQIQDEFNDHLSSAIQARLELGEPPEIAELNVVRSLGSPKKIAHSFEYETPTINSFSFWSGLAASLFLVLTVAYEGSGVFPWLLAAFAGAATFTVYLSSKTYLSRKTVLWTASLSLLFFSVSLPIARVSPPGNDSVSFASGSFPLQQQFFDQQWQADIAALVKSASTTNPRVTIKTLESDAKSRSEFEAARKMFLVRRLKRGFFQNLPLAELGTLMISLLLLVPHKLKLRLRRKSFPEVVK